MLDDSQILFILQKHSTGLDELKNLAIVLFLYEFGADSMACCFVCMTYQLIIQTKWI